MKKPEDLLYHDQPSPECEGTPPTHLTRWFQADKPLDGDEEAPACERQDYGEFVHTLGRSIVERNAQARKGPRGHQARKKRSRQALGRALSKLMQD